MEINGHKLPAELVALMDTPLWDEYHKMWPLNSPRPYQNPGPFKLDRIDTIQRQTAFMVDLAQSEYADIYGLVYEKNAPEGYLDAVMAVMVSATFDEEALCLDYSRNPAQPSVVVGVWPQKSGYSFWIEVTSTVEQFIALLKAESKSAS